MLKGEPPEGLPGRGPRMTAMGADDPAAGRFADCQHGVSISPARNALPMRLAPSGDRAPPTPMPNR